MKELLKQDADNMLAIMERLSYRADIWQDRFIYWIARAIYDLIIYTLKRDRG